MKTSVPRPAGRPARRPQIAGWVAGFALATGAIAAVSLSASTASAACDALQVPTVGIERCVVAGDQAQIDAGNVVRMDRLSTPEVHWLAGHRTSHGGTFRALPGLGIGDAVEYRGLTYEIVEYTTAPFTDPGRVLAWSRASEPTLVLQTSRDSSSAHLWRAEAIVAATPAAARPQPLPQPKPHTFRVAVPGATGADAVVVNLTAVNPTGPGYLTAYTCNTTRPTTSNLNYANPTTVQANLVIVHPDTDGNICIYTSQTTDIIIDTLGTFPANSDYDPTTPIRLTDTRNHRQLATAATLEVAVPGATGADAVVVNLTAVNPTGPGYLTAYTCNTTRPTTSNLNYANPTTVQANLVIVHPDTDGNICIYTSQTTDIIIDTLGTFPANSDYDPTTPIRLTDTRNHRQLATAATLEVAVPGATGADAVVVNLTAVNPTGPGYLTAYTCNTTRPTTSNLNYANPTTVQANLVIVHPDTDGNICIYTSQTTDIIIDTLGTFPANSDYDPTTPIRLTDTRNHRIR